jgi:uncharacterized membrane protein YkvA (DUF1232 family)
MDKNDLLRSATERAKKLAKDPKALGVLIEQARAKAKAAGDPGGKFAAVREGLQGLIRLVKAWVGGRYRRVPWPTMAMAIASLIYFVNPFDLIPDFIIGTGLLDDATVIAMVLNALKHDIELFKKWETEVSEAGAAGPDAPPAGPS